MGQNCIYTLQGKIKDKGTQEALSFSTIQIVELGKGAVADENGNYLITDLCPGEYHAMISHMGFESAKFYLKITGDSQNDFLINHHDELLNEITIHGTIHEQSTLVSQSINEQEIQSSGNQNLADIVGRISGVSVIKNGSGISKPVIHGLYGNRISILNNGVVQAGQQWGQDHAPEIDPFSADHISVVKGASTLSHNGNSIGGLLLIEPGPITQDPHLHGIINYGFQTNGLGHTLNTKLEKKSNWAAWRFNLTGKILGDTHTPDYYLTNTGRKEYSASFQVEKQLSSKWFLNAYLSSFNTNIGILKGAHVGNEDDLEDAIGRDEPLFTNDYFSYGINPPRQFVRHHLIKSSLDHHISDQQKLTFQYAFQINQREEFDVRRGGRSDLPAMSLNLLAQDIDLKYDHTFTNNFDLETGIQNTYTQNNNDNGETGTYPFIPDYNSNRIGTYIIGKQEVGKWFYELGGRISYRYLEAITINRTEADIVRYYHDNINYSLVGGISYSLLENLKSSFNLSFAQRSPEVNEWYSSGLHQGVARIERGNEDLVDESLLNYNLSIDFNPIKDFHIFLLGYSQQFKNYILLEPQEEREVTIRGTFNVFEYQQIKKASISGLDINLTYHPSHHWKLNYSYSLIRGNDKNLNQPLIYIPADNMDLQLQYNWSNMEKIGTPYISARAEYVFEQKRYVEEQDYLVPPSDYLLLGLNLGTKIQTKKHALNVVFKIDNLLNTVYRDYLNALRYYADEQGRNFKFAISYSF